MFRCLTWPRSCWWASLWRGSVFPPSSSHSPSTDRYFELGFVNVSRAQESIPRNRLRQPMLLGGPVRQTVLSCWPAGLQRLASSIPCAPWKFKNTVSNYNGWKKFGFLNLLLLHGGDQFLSSKRFTSAYTLYFCTVLYMYLCTDYASRKGGVDTK